MYVITISASYHKSSITATEAGCVWLIKTIFFCQELTYFFAIFCYQKYFIAFRVA